MYLSYFLLIKLFLIAEIYQTTLVNCFSGGPCVEQITEPLGHAEEPTWDDRVKLLYFVDIHVGNVYSYDPVSKALNHIHLDGDVTPVINTKYDMDIFIIGLNRTLQAVKWHPNTSKLLSRGTLTTVSKEYPTSRFNDGKADADGRLWIGTMGYENSSGVLPHEGSLYLVTKQDIDNPTKVITPVSISNGLAWNKANTKFFYIDTPTLQVRVYDFDLASGTISNPKVVFDVRNHKDVITGSPDGMTIDVDDNIWVALYGGGAVVKVDTKTSKLLQIVPIPALDVTSVSWGGDKLDVLYVTTSRYALSDDQRKQQPAAGSVFAVKGLGTKGLPAHYADILDEKQLSCLRQN